MGETANRALEAYNRGEFGAALSLAQAELSQNSNDAGALGVVGLVRAQGREFKEAVGYLAQAIESGGDLPALPAALFYCQARLNGPVSARQLLSSLLAQRPRFSALRLELVHYHYRAQEHDAELALCTEGLDAGDTSAELGLAHARALLNTNQTEKAVVALAKITAAQPTIPEPYFLLGTGLRSLGRLEEARRAHLQAMEQASFYPRSFYAYMRSRAMDESDPVVARFGEVEKRLASVGDGAATFLHYGMGKAFEDMGRYDEAFAHYERGGRITAKSRSYDRGAVEREFKNVKEFFTAERLSSLKGLGDPEARSIFIVGMPRSGSTLVEQILASHSGVDALGELLDLDRIFRPHLGQLSEDNIPWAELGAAYTTGLAQKTTQPGLRPVDKGLHNFVLIGFIQILFPNAVILHCERDAMDTCFSCFSLRFANGHAWSNRQSDTAHYYGCYRDLMEHWQKVLPGRIATIRYEDLTTDFEPQVRQLLDACDLPWEPACLAFHETDRTVRTASSAQVRQPVSTGSIGRWKRFEPHLSELKTGLGIAGV